MWPDGEDIMYIPDPQGGFLGGGFQCLHLEGLHVEVCYHRGQRRAHCCSFCLFVVGVTKFEVCGLQA